LPWPVHYETIDEPGFGGWADEKIEPAREAAPNVLIGEPAGNEIELTHTPAAPESKKDSSTTFDNISIIPTGPRNYESTKAALCIGLL